MTDQLSPDFQWAFLQQLQHQQQQQQQQQQQLQQQQQQHQQQTNHMQQQANNPDTSMNFTSNFQVASAPSALQNTKNNQNNQMGNLDSQLWQLYQNFTSSASNRTNAIPSAVSSSASNSFTNNGGMVTRMESTTPDLCQSRTMMAQGQQMQMLANTQVGTTTTSANMSGFTQTKSAGTSNALSQLMLQSTVEPFQRGNASSGDDEDLWKVFDDEFTTKKLNLPNHNVLFPSQYQQLQQAGSNSNRRALNADIAFTAQNTQQYRQADTGMNPNPGVVRQQVSNDPLPPPENPEDYEPEPFDLPSTMIPPSVLALSSGPSKRNAAHDTAAPKPKRLKHLQPSVSPQTFLERLLSDRGHTYKRILADDAEYDAVPSALQLASFGTTLVKAVHTSDVAKLRNLLACGLSPNPCNQFRDSILDLVCKRANESVFEVLLEMGADLQVVDAFGRTPLHHACWASEFCEPIVTMILQRDPIQLCIEDKHGQTPLEYVRGDLYDEWLEFLRQNMHKYFDPPPSWTSPKERRPEGAVLDPENSIGVSLAALVSSGTLTPEQISQMDEETRQKYKTKS